MEEALELRDPEEPGLRDRLLQQRDGVVRLASLDVGQGQHAERRHPVQRVERQLHAPAAGGDGRLPVAGQCADEAGRPRRVTLEPAVAHGLGQRPGSLLGLEAFLEAPSI